MYGNLTVVTFEWDSDKDRINQSKHGVSFEEAQLAFADPKRVMRSITNTATTASKDSSALARRIVEC